MIQEGWLVKGCSKSKAIWALFMGSFAIMGGSSPPPPHSYAYAIYLSSLCISDIYTFILIQWYGFPIILKQKSTLAIL